LAGKDGFDLGHERSNQLLSQNYRLALWAMSMETNGARGNKGIGIKASKRIFRVWE
jgi:hypothetical protein